MLLVLSICPNFQFQALNFDCSVLRQDHLPALPPKERDAQDFFEPSDRHGEGRLSDMKGFGRLRERSRPDDDDEVLQLSRFHDRLLRKRGQKSISRIYIFIKN